MSGDQSRGQIQFDFAVGVSIFVMTLIVAFTFIPGLFGGATGGRVQSDQVAADRVAEWLATDGLGDPSNPGEVDVDCAVALFDSGRTACGFDGGSAGENVEGGFAELERFVLVSIQRDGSQVCWDGSADQFRTGASCSGVELSSSGSPAGSSTVSAATRPVSIDGFRATVVVRVW